MKTGEGWSLLSKRERQIMDALYLLGAGAVSDVRRSLADAPSYSAVRTTMNILVRKGFLATRADGHRYLYRPVIPHGKARRTAARHLVRTYFDGSVQAAVMGLIDAGVRLNDDEYGELIAMIRKARRARKREAKM